ncbi:MAG: NAD-dependent epimerase/dehydratase family protein [Draconibacterium sp.]
MKTIDKSKPVLVTGATGYVAGWLVKKLLEEGLTVHAAVRNPENKEKLKFLDEMAQNTSGEIRYFKADLLEEGSFAEAMTGCELVFHTASPFTTDVKDPQKELVNPAKQGTRNVLEQANKTPSVKRIVLTSSVAAIYGDNADLENTPGKVFTEEIWNTSSSLEHQPYSYSKTLAEKEAWKICEDQLQWDLVVINPSLVIGPAINPAHVTSESFRIIQPFGDGKFKMGVPKLGMGLVDVRDVAEAHFRAGFKPEAAGRYIISGYNTWFLDMAKTLQPKYGAKYPVPKKEMPKWLIWLMGPMINKAATRKYISRNMGLPFVADNSKSITQLDMKYCPMEDSLNEMFQQMIDSKLI